MNLPSPHLAQFLRAIAIVCLLLGLNDASRLLGVSLGETSPIEAMGTTGFVYLAIFALTRLFAAVGLWIKASWGAVMLVAATAIELTLYVVGNPDVQMTAFGFAVRIFLVVSVLVVFGLSIRFRMARRHD